MVIQEYGEYVFICSVCGAISYERFETYEEAMVARKEMGWKSEKYKEWYRHICPECQEGY